MSRPTERIVDRRVLPLVLERMIDDPVVLLEGPRSVGKSTLLRAVAEGCSGRILDLDDVATRDAVAVDPATFVAGEQTVCIDEYQKAPVVLDAIKAQLNRGSRPGRFVLTGSTRHDALPTAAQSLTGRLFRLPVYPLSQGELARVQENLLGRLLDDAGDTVASMPNSATTRSQYIERIVAGGFPIALAASTPAARGRWIDNYIALTPERDVRELSRLRQGNALSAVLHRLAGQTAQVLSLERAGRDAGLHATTVDDYVTLLKKVFLLYRLPSWGKTLRARVTSRPKGSTYWIPE